MTERVIDASALGYALIGKTAQARSLRTALRGTDCHAPHLIDAELGHLLRRQVRVGDLTPAQALSALRAAEDVIDVRYAHTGSLADLAWTLRENLSYYDALFVSLAACLDMPLMTGDGRLGRAPSLPCVIELV